jgi:glyoxylase-like metal-dependent hydrolase (beta-lactamase superfamily II)
MNGFTTPEAALAALRTPRFVDANFISHHLEFQRGVLVFPLLTPTLPPATHTNAYVLGTGECLIVDPGSPDELETGRLIDFVRALDYRPKAVVLTHQHADHVGGALQVSRELGIPIWAHRLAAAQLPFEVARFLEEGEVLELDGPLVTRWRVLHTPGHARGHVCLVNVATRLGLVGDMVAGVGTIVIDPPEGDMAEYLRQLERLKEHLDVLCPAHGNISVDAVAKLEEYLLHRAWREAKVLEAFAAFDGPVKTEDLVVKAYDDVMAFVWPIAERNIMAILEKLRAEGRVAQRDGAWARVPAG